MTMRSIHCLVLGALLAAPLAAQESGTSKYRLQVHGGFISPLEGVKKLTHNNQGFTLGAALTTLVPGTTIDARVGIAFHGFPGREFGPSGQVSVNNGTADDPVIVTVTAVPLKSSMRSWQVNGDILFDVGIPRTKMVLGASLNRYVVRNSGGPLIRNLHYNADPIYGWGRVLVDHAWATRDYSGVKMGLRAGLEVTLTRHLSADILLQQTELSGAQRKARTSGPVNPSWIQVGARYTF